MTDIAAPEHIDVEVLRQLAQLDGPTATIAFPTVRAAYSSEQNATKLKNALREVDEHFTALGYTEDEIEARVSSARKLLGDHDFWMHQLDGLVLHLGPHQDAVWRTPFSVPERVAVQDAPLLTPLLPALAESGEFSILAISRDHVRLLRAASTGFERVDLAAHDVPTSTSELPGDDEPPELQQRAGGAGGDPSIFHGHENSDHDRIIAERLFRTVDDRVHHLLVGGAPVVLAGVEENVAHYRHITQLPGVLDEAVIGAPEHRPDQDLHAAARQLVIPHLRAPVDEALERLRERLGTGLATTDLTELLRAVTTGRVDTVLVARGAVVWGTVDAYGEATMRTDDPQPGDEDLIDAAVRFGLRRGGRALVVDPDDMPDGAAAAGVFRF